MLDSAIPSTDTLNCYSAPARCLSRKGNAFSVLSPAVVGVTPEFHRWVRTGDKVIVDENGDLFLVARQKVRQSRRDPGPKRVDLRHRFISGV